MTSSGTETTTEKTSWTSKHAVWFALIFSIVLVVPVAALTYRWIEKPALDAARQGVSVRGLARAISGSAESFEVGPAVVAAQRAETA